MVLPLWKRSTLSVGNPNQNNGMKAEILLLGQETCYPECGKE